MFSLLSKRKPAVSCLNMGLYRWGAGHTLSELLEHMSQFICQFFYQFTHSHNDRERNTLFIFPELPNQATDCWWCITFPKNCCQGVGMDCWCTLYRFPPQSSLIEKVIWICEELHTSGSKFHFFLIFRSSQLLNNLSLLESICLSHMKHHLYRNTFPSHLVRVSFSN